MGSRRARGWDRGLGGRGKVEGWLWRGARGLRSLRRWATQAGRQILRLEPAPDRLGEKRLQLLGITEADLGLGRVDVDIDVARRQVQEQEADRVPARHQQATVGVLKCLGQQLVADPAAVDKEILQLRATALAGRI